jgi:molybdate transport system permease protein
VEERTDAPAYGRGFDAFLAVPLAGYLILIGVLILGVFAVIVREPGAIREALTEPALLYAVKLSLITTAVSTLLSILVAVPAGYVLSRQRFPGHFFLDTVLDLPIVLPPLVMGLCVLIFFNTSLGRFLDRGIVREGIFIYQPLGIVLVQFVIGCAFAVRVIKAGFDGLDPAYEQVAMTLGANRPQAFFKVVLPNIVPSLVAGAVISWARVFGLFGPVLLVAGTMRFRTEIMPTTIFLETSIGRIEVALVIGACMILISMTTLLVFKKLGGKGYLW